VVEGDGIRLELLPALLGQVCLRPVRREALDRAQAAVRARGRQRLSRLARGRRHGARPLREVGLREWCPAVRLGGAEVVGRGQVELGGLLRREGGGRHGEARRGVGRARRRARRLLEVGESARLGAVGGTVGLLVAGQAELVRPEIESHGGGGLEGGVCVLLKEWPGC
jgi:hypothetical protein